MGDVFDIVICILLVVSLLSLMLSNRRLVRIQSKHINFIYNVMDILSNQCSPMRSKLYEEAVKAGPFGKIPCINDVAQKFNFEQYSALKKHYTKMAESIDCPIQKEKLNTALSELDDVYNVICTISPDSSQEYLESVQKTMMASMHKLQNLFSGIGYEGEGPF